MILRALVLVLTLSGAAHAQELRHLPPTPDDFAWQWPLTVDPKEDLLQVELTPEVYARLWRDDVSDLVVFNAHDEAVPTAPLGDALTRAEPAASVPGAPVEVPLFRVPAGTQGSASERLRLVVAQRTDGRLERLEATIDAAPEASASGEVLLDLSAAGGRVRALQVDFDANTDGLIARVDVFGSKDLSSWTRLAAGQALVALNDNGLRLERRRIEFSATRLPYLRLVRVDARGAPLPILRVSAVRQVRPEIAPRELEHARLSGRAETGLPGFLYLSDGPLPIERLSVILAERNSAANVVIESRSRSDLPWRERARGAVFRLEGKAGAIESSSFELAAVRDRQWRVRIDPVQLHAPTLDIAWRPDRFAFLTQGEGPFRLAAGSARSQRGTFPLEAVLAEAREARGADWMPTQARLGRGAELAGGAALAPRPDASGSPTPLQWLLWALLLAGAFSVVTMVLRLLRQTSA